MEKPAIALTFDDGPNTSITVQILDLLDAYRIPATFFVIGQNIQKKTASVLKRAYDMGCEIGSHSFSHRDMSRLSTERIREEMERTDERIQSVTGEPSRYFRAPYLFTSPLMFQEIDKTFIAGIHTDTWGNASERYHSIIRKVSDGSIILLHDKLENYPTVQALQMLIPDLLSQGYSLLTLSELFRQKGTIPQRGRIYSRVP